MTRVGARLADSAAPSASGDTWPSAAARGSMLSEPRPIRRTARSTEPCRSALARMRIGGLPASPLASTSQPASRNRAWRAAARQVACAIWVPVTKPMLTVSGRPNRSRSQPAATSSTTDAAGPQAWMPAFWSQTLVSQSAAIAAGEPPPITQPKNRPPCEPRMPPAVSATRSSTTRRPSTPRSASGRPRRARISSSVAVVATGRASRPSIQASACSAARRRISRSEDVVGMGPSSRGLWGLAQVGVNRAASNGPPRDSARSILPSRRAA